MTNNKYRLPGPRLMHKEEWRERDIYSDAYINAYVLRCVAVMAVVFLIVVAVASR